MVSVLLNAEDEKFGPYTNHREHPVANYYLDRRILTTLDIDTIKANADNSYAYILFPTGDQTYYLLKNWLSEQKEILLEYEGCYVFKLID